MREFNRSFHFQAAGHEFRICNYYSDSRNGFAHTSAVFMDGLTLREATCHYCNRTWECFPYQSSALAAVRASIDYYTAGIVRRYKLNNGVQRITKRHREKLEALYRESSLISGLRAALDVLGENHAPATIHSWEVSA